MSIAALHGPHSHQTVQCSYNSKHSNVWRIDFLATDPSMLEPLDSYDLQCLVVRFITSLEVWILLSITVSSESPSHQEPTRGGLGRVYGSGFSECIYTYRKN